MARDAPSAAGLPRGHASVHTVFVLLTLVAEELKILSKEIS